MHLMARVVFMGSPDFAVPILRSLASQHQICGVVTQPDREAGRGRGLKAPAVKLAATELGLPLIQPSKLKEPEAAETLREWAPEIIVVAAFGQILRPEILQLPPRGCLNVHASLLPRWRGAAPIQAAILAGDAESGATIMLMDAGVDTGPILAQRQLEITHEDTSVTLATRISTAGAALLLEVLPRFLSGQIRPVPQDESLATKAPMLRKRDGLLDPSRSAAELERRVRALDPWPGAYLEWKGRILKILAAHAIPGTFAPGGHVLHEGGIAIGTSEGALVLDMVQLEGRKRVSGPEFLAGARDWRE